MPAAWAPRTPGALLPEGARVAIGDVIDDVDKAQADELGTDVAYLRLDVSQPDQWDSAVK